LISESQKYKVHTEKILKNVLMVLNEVAEILRTPKSKARPLISDKPDRADVLPIRRA
jgi:hypothetical protein